MLYLYLTNHHKFIPGELETNALISLIYTIFNYFIFLLSMNLFIVTPFL